MPMAISFLAAGIIFRLVYEQDPGRGVANAVVVGVHDTFADHPATTRARDRGPDAALTGRGRRLPHDRDAPARGRRRPAAGRRSRPENVPADAQAARGTDDARPAR